MKTIRLLAVGAACLLTACGTIMHGTNQQIMVQSTPSAVKVESSPVTGSFTTPTTLNLERKNTYVLTFSSPGYTSQTAYITNGVGVGTVIADIVLGIVPVAIDAITGGWYGLSPEAVNVTLVKSGTGSGPDSIHVQIANSKDGSGIAVKSDAPASAPAVTVQVVKK